MRTSVQAYISIIPPRGSKEETTVSSRFEEQGPAPGSSGGGSSTFDGRFINPMPKGNVQRGGKTQFGAPRPGRIHEGVDLGGLPENEPFYASAAGKVIEAGSGSYKVIAIDHGTFNGARYITRYLHCNVIKVRVGETVKQNQEIGGIGGWGPKGRRQFGIHLHLEIRKNGRALDPEDFIGRVPRGG